MLATKLIDLFHYEKSHYFALGRNAMYAGCMGLHLVEGDEILTPAFDCSGSLEPFAALKLKLVFYKIDPHTFRVDLNDLNNKVTPRTKLVHVINYFGFSQKWDELLDFRSRTKIPILEDNAYSLFSHYKGQPLGQFGDVAIFSLRKNLDLIDGGVLVINNPDIAPPDPVRNTPWFYCVDWLSAARLARKTLNMPRLPFWIKRSFHILEGPPLASNGDFDFDCHEEISQDFACHYMRPMSRISRRLFSKWKGLDIERIRTQKRKIYERMSQELSSLSNIRVLNSQLDEGEAPYCLCLVIENSRDQYLRNLSDEFPVWSWPTLSQSVKQRLHEFEEVEYLGKRVLLFNLSLGDIFKRDFEDVVVNFIKRINLK